MQRRQCDPTFKGIVTCSGFIRIGEILEIQGDPESVDDDELGTTEKPNYLSYTLLRIFESFLGSASGTLSELIDLAPD